MSNRTETGKSKNSSEKDNSITRKFKNGWEKFRNSCGDLLSHANKKLDGLRVFIDKIGSREQSQQGTSSEEHDFRITDESEEIGLQDEAGAPRVEEELSGSEDIYYREMDVIKTLMVSLDELDNEKAGILNIDQFGAAIKKAFPMKLDQDIEALVSAAQAELEMVLDTTTSIDYRALFTEDEEGNTGPFLTLLRQQEREERAAYVDEIFKQLEGKDEVPMQEMKETLMMLDPQITSPIMQKYLSIAYSCTPELTEQAEPAALDAIIDRMKKGGIYRVGTPL